MVVAALLLVLLRILSAVLEPGSVPGMHIHYNHHHCAVVVAVLLLLLAQRRSHEQELLLDGIPTGMTILIKIIIKYNHPPYCSRISSLLLCCWRCSALLRPARDGDRRPEDSAQ